MKYRFLTALGLVAVTAVVFGSLTLSAQSQARSAAGKASPATAKGTRTPWGDPDLQGVYLVASLTPMERPAAMADREFLTDAEAKAIEQRAAGTQGQEIEIRSGDTGYYNRFWGDPSTRVVPSHRTSLIIDPPDGRLPALTLQAQKIRDRIRDILAKDGALVFNRVGPTRLAREGSGLADSYLDRDSTERCLATSIPKLGGPYNNGVQISQGPGFVVIKYEMINDTRVISLDGRPHLPANIHQYLGDARGHWEGDTLVVDTTNFSDEHGYLQGYPQGHLHLVERFKRSGDNMLDYQATFDDPTTFTKPFTVSLPWQRNPDYVIYEYACHEGNDSLTGILSGARSAEKQAARPKAPSQ